MRYPGIGSLKVNVGSLSIVLAKHDEISQCTPILSGVDVCHFFDT